MPFVVCADAVSSLLSREEFKHQAPKTLFVVNDDTEQDVTCFVQKMESAAKYFSFFTSSSNVTQPTLKSLHHQPTILIYFSNCVSSIRHFCNEIVVKHLITSSSRLVIVTYEEKQATLSNLANCWAFEMMNTVLIVLETVQRNVSCRATAFTHLPYSPSGPTTQLVASYDNLAQWQMFGQFFPDKFKDFHGATIDVCARDYPPFWTEANNTSGYGGSDGQLLTAIAKTLNFTFSVLPSSSWDEISSLVSSRKCLLVSVEHYVYPERLLHYEYSHVYMVSDMAFSMAKPKMKGYWTSLLRPLNNTVWAAILATMLLLPLPLIMIHTMSKIRESSTNGDFQRTVSDTNMSGRFSLNVEYFSVYPLLLMKVIRTLLNQSISTNISSLISSNVALASCLIFSFLCTSAYTCNLVAFLTLPKLEKRSETLEQLVTSGARLTCPPHVKALQNLFSISEVESYRDLVNRFDYVPSIQECLSIALQSGSAAIEDRLYMSYAIASELSGTGGNSPLYVAKEGLLMGLMAWPIPHHALYKEHIDDIMQRVAESGLYQKWVEQQLGSLSLEKRVCAACEDAAEDEALGPVTLSLTHLQGAWVTLFGGWLLAIVAFALECSLDSLRPSGADTARAVVT